MYAYTRAHTRTHTMQGVIPTLSLCTIYDYTVYYKYEITLVDILKSQLYILLHYMIQGVIPTLSSVRETDAHTRERSCVRLREKTTWYSHAYIRTHTRIHICTHTHMTLIGCRIGTKSILRERNDTAIHTHTHVYVRTHIQNTQNSYDVFVWCCVCVCTTSESCVFFETKNILRERHSIYIHTHIHTYTHAYSTHKVSEAKASRPFVLSGVLVDILKSQLYILLHCYNIYYYTYVHYILVHNIIHDAHYILSHYTLYTITLYTKNITPYTNTLHTTLCTPYTNMKLRW